MIKRELVKWAKERKVENLMEQEHSNVTKCKEGKKKKMKPTDEKRKPKN